MTLKCSTASARSHAAGRDFSRDVHEAAPDRSFHQTIRGLCHPGQVGRIEFGVVVVLEGKAATNRRFNGHAQGQRRIDRLVCRIRQSAVDIGNLACIEHVHAETDTGNRQVLQAARIIRVHIELEIETHLVVGTATRIGNTDVCLELAPVLDGGGDRATRTGEDGGNRSHGHAKHQRQD